MSNADLRTATLQEASAIREFERLTGAPLAHSQGSAGSEASGPDEFAPFHQFLEALPAALYTTDAAGRITFYNEAAAVLWGHRPALGTDEWCGSWKLYWPDGTLLPHGECPMAMALKEGRAIHGMEAVAERPDGTRVPFLAYSTPFFSPAGEVTGAINILVDITERKAAELATQRLAAIVDSSDDAIISKDLNGIITSWNAGAERLFLYTEQEVVGKSVTILMPPDRQDEEAGILQRLRRGERIDHFETVRQRKDGSLVDISLSISPIAGQKGRVVGASKIARDISERKSAEKFKDVLLAEMKHRVKNTLALAASISRQTFDSVTDEEQHIFAARLEALGNAHDVLAKQSWEGADLNEVVTKTMEPHRTGQGRIHLSGPDIAVEAGKAVAVALALHELATNATKYGSLSVPGGTLDIVWERLDADRIRLHWQESGGPTVVKPQRRGFGTRLIERALAAELTKVLLDFNPEGVTCEMEFNR
jgi:PAS domain S-box-containing protein